MLSTKALSEKENRKESHVTKSQCVGGGEGRDQVRETVKE